MNKSLISDVLIDAYASTNYVVESKPNFTLRVGSQCKELARIYEKANVSTACLITAYNPFSVLFTPPHNVARQAELLNEIAAFKLKFVFGYGQSNDSEWKEPSVLILGITYDQSMELAVKHEQNAFIWCDEQATPKLVLTR
jgi:hypothetical protein